MKKALKRRISLSLKEIKIKNTTKPWTSEEKQGPGAADTNSAGENANVPDVRLWLFSIPRLQGPPPGSSAPAVAFSVQPCYPLPMHVNNHLPGTLSMVLSFIPAKTKVPVNSTSAFTSLHLSHLYCHTAYKASFSRTRQGRAVPPNNNFKLVNVTDLLLQSSKQKADKMALWIGVVWCQAWWPQFYAWEPHDGKRQLLQVFWPSHVNRGTTYHQNK